MHHLVAKICIWPYLLVVANIVKIIIYKALMFLLLVAGIHNLDRISAGLLSEMTKAMAMRFSMPDICNKKGKKLEMICVVLFMFTD